MRRTDGEWNSKLARGDFDRHNTRTPYGKHILQHTQSARGDLAHSPQRTRCLYNVQIILPTSSAGRIIAVQSHRPIFTAGPLQATRRKDAGSGGSGKSQVKFFCFFYCGDEWPSAMETEKAGQFTVFFASVYQSGGVFNCDKKFNNAPKRTVAAYAEWFVSMFQFFNSQFLRQSKNWHFSQGFVDFGIFFTWC